MCMTRGFQTKSIPSIIIRAVKMYVIITPVTDQSCSMKPTSQLQDRKSCSVCGTAIGRRLQVVCKCVGAIDLTIDSQLRSMYQAWSPCTLFHSDWPVAHASDMASRQPTRNRMSLLVRRSTLDSLSGGRVEFCMSLVSWPVYTTRPCTHWVLRSRAPRSTTWSEPTGSWLGGGDA